ncbi:MAG: mannose-phosphate guanylyltransferase, partial [Acidobacteriota bacterium]|nr:mannose-phosphate guanylyltransferase [Acidobacteriota bacterium]
MKGMILAAGYGTRLRPITYTLPKPMVPLCNLPLIGWAVESYLKAGVQDLVINLHHLPEQIERYLQDHYAGDARFYFSREEQILGTGGGVRRVRHALEPDEAFFLVNGDTVQFPRYGALNDARRELDAVASLTLRHPPEGDKFTAVWLEDGRVTGFGEGTGEAMMFAGSHCISSRLFRYLPDQEVSGIVDAAYQPLLAQGRETLAGVADDGLWFDIGTPRRYLAAMRALIDATGRGDVPLAKGSQIRGGSIVDETGTAGAVTRSTVGARSVVEGDVRDSAIWDDCAIGPEVMLERCIVGHGVTLTGDLELRDSIIVRDDPAIPREVERRGGVVV